jgi:ubiquinone/menaquinone biosynthesis C-methylase UbiE
LGVPFEPVDRPFIDYWRHKMPEDFPLDRPLAKHWLEFELGGIERGKQLLEKISRHVSVKDKVVLDVGAGNGGMCIAAALSQAREVHGIEIERSRIDLAYRWAACRGVKVDIQEGVAEKLPFPDSSIDILFLWAVIEHVDDPEQTLNEMARVLRPGGYAVINAPNRLSPQFFMRDPHYQIMAVSALPHSIAKWWVTKVRKISPQYGVGIFPIYSLLMRSLRKRGFRLVTEDHHQYLIERLENPDLIRSGMRIPMKALGSLGLTKLGATVLRNTSPLFEVLVRKEPPGHV